MQHSLTYYLTHTVLKAKGIKKDFSASPIDYIKVRKDDILKPSGRFYKKHITKEWEVANSKLTEINNKTCSDSLLLYVHGGAFISGPGKHHWDSLQTIAQKTTTTIWMCNYPKAPEYGVSEISQSIDAVYAAALEKFPAHKITLMGDSAGGTLITNLTQRLLLKGISLPKELLLISPVMDASLSNPEISKIDPKDPMLSYEGVLSAKKMYAKNYLLTAAEVSPLYGSFKGFPKTTFFIASHDITYPDQLLTIEKMRKDGIVVEVFEGDQMPHIWPLLPVMKEAKIALKRIIGLLNS
ncbi:MAG: alpha/beta hydrolase fold domain-containing protein [Flavicella sp.]